MVKELDLTDKKYVRDWIVKICTLYKANKVVEYPNYEAKLEELVKELLDEVIDDDDIENCEFAEYKRHIYYYGLEDKLLYEILKKVAKKV